MKDALGHGSNSQGRGDRSAAFNTAHQAALFGRQGSSLMPSRAEGARFLASRGFLISDRQAAGALAQGHAKSAPVPTHPSFS
jgi:hypothetical protein